MKLRFFRFLNFLVILTFVTLNISQNFVVAVDDIKNVLFKRMCAPVGQLTRMECIGLRRDENIVDFPQGKFFILAFYG